MKIVITGTYCSGKTTLCYDLIQAIPNCKLLLEEAREISDLIPPDGWSLPAIREYLLVRQILNEKRNEKDDKLLICDNGVHGNLAHDSLLTKEVNNILLLDQLDHINYDLVFFCDHHEVAIEQDGVRLVDPFLRERAAEEILKFIELLGSKPIILFGDREQRVRAVLRHLPFNMTN
ncbi:ATP/GTP-binding protein [Larkinella terrae]|uniref:AAA family ATPase n=1 Tax=Larkinella terrae TaxID=2025311 RepID=A0A7K0ESF9_9BACT|nr:ATP-binding protein [Larkinella terrae]MRS64755.1 AAA family ATPase [Larkinella terrae]